MLSLCELPVVQVPRSAPDPIEAQASVFSHYAGAFRKQQPRQICFCACFSRPLVAKRGKGEVSTLAPPQMLGRGRRQYWDAQAQLVAGFERRRACVRLSWFKGLVLFDLSQNHMMEGDPLYVLVPILPHLGFT